MLAGCPPDSCYGALLATTILGVAMLTADHRSIEIVLRTMFSLLTITINNNHKSTHKRSTFPQHYFVGLGICPYPLLVFQLGCSTRQLHLTHMVA
mmetsp:Transcript_22021/g.37919  ORF Transcript_22021/g.37919 Transcript_22021/m.37919 type:complete len:95 (-) Transcript_22021:213-497(-)